MPRLVIGGQAVIEGVMMRSRQYVSVAVRTPKGKISSKTEKIRGLSNRYTFLRLPFLRGTVALFENLVLGYKALTWSANEAAGEEADLSVLEMALSLVIALGLGLGLFIAAPLFLSGLLIKNNEIAFNILDGLLRLVIFVLYILAISMLRDVRRLFRYHGAEHMAVNAHEAGKKLTVKNVMPFTTYHPRCGTSFLVIVVFISIVVFTAVSHPSIWIKLLSRIILLPVIASLSFEALYFSAKFRRNPVMQPVIWLGKATQAITTQRPDRQMVEVAIKALKEVLKKERAT